MPAHHESNAAADADGQSSDSRQTASFEESLAQLGDIVVRLESGALGLSESIAAYERGVTILRRLHDELAAVEERVRLLVRIDEQGRPVLDSLPQPAANEPMAQTAKTRAARGSTAAKGSRSKPLPGMDDASDHA